MSSLKGKLLQFVVLPAVGALMLAAGCTQQLASPDNDPPPGMWTSVPATQPSASEVAIDNFTFKPSTITVAVGTTVSWVNHDDVPHTVTANDKAFTSKTMDTDDRYSHQFTAPGTYPYFCAVHKHMTAQVIVK